MNKRYMDFAPRKSSSTGVGRPVKAGGARRTTVGAVGNSVKRPKIAQKVVRTRKPIAKPAAKSVVKPVARSVKSVAKPVEEEVNFGVIEDLATEVEVEPMKAEPAKKPLSGDMMSIPRTPFINQNKVEKRPLSKNVYRKKVEPTKEVTTGPVTIISKPEKDKKIGLVVTIIITVILGAVAGTVAFLLLPK